MKWWWRCLPCGGVRSLQPPQRRALIPEQESTAKLPGEAIQEQEPTATLPRGAILEQLSEEQPYGHAYIIILALLSGPLLFILLVAWRSFWSSVAPPKQIGRPLPLCSVWSSREDECFNAYCGLVVPARNSSINKSFFRAPHKNVTTWHDLPESCKTVWQTDIATRETGDKCHAWCKSLPHFAFGFFRLDCMDPSGVSGGVVHTVCGKALVAHWFDPIPEDWFPCIQYLGGILYGLIGFLLFLCQLPSPGRSGGYREVPQQSGDDSTPTNDQWKCCACFNGLRWLLLEAGDENAHQTGLSKEEITDDGPFGGKPCPTGPSKNEIAENGPFNSKCCPGFPLYKAQEGECHACACDLLCETEGLRSYKSDAQGVRKQLKMMIPSMILEAILDASGVLSYLMNGQPSYAAAVVTSMSSGKDPMQVVGLSHVASSLQVGFKSKRLLVWEMLNGLRDTGVGAVIAFYSLVTSPHHYLPWHAAPLRLMTIVLGFCHAIPKATEAWWLVRMASIGRVNLDNFYGRQECLAKLKYEYFNREYVKCEVPVKYADSAALLSMAFMASLSKLSGNRVLIFFFFASAFFSILVQTANCASLNPKHLTLVSFMCRPSVLYVVCSPLFVCQILTYPDAMQHIQLKIDDIKRGAWPLSSCNFICLAQAFSLSAGLLASALSFFFVPGVLKTFIKAHRR